MGIDFSVHYFGSGADQNVAASALGRSPAHARQGNDKVHGRTGAMGLSVRRRGAAQKLYLNA